MPRRKSRYFTKTALSRISTWSSSSGRGGGPASTSPVFTSNCPRWHGQRKVLWSLSYVKLQLRWVQCPLYALNFAPSWVNSHTPFSVRLSSQASTELWTKLTRIGTPTSRSAMSSATLIQSSVRRVGSIGETNARNAGYPTSVALIAAPIPVTHRRNLRRPFSAASCGVSACPVLGGIMLLLGRDPERVRRVPAIAGNIRFGAALSARITLTSETGNRRLESR